MTNGYAAHKKEVFKSNRFSVNIFHLSCYVRLLSWGFVLLFNNGRQVVGNE